MGQVLRSRKIYSRTSRLADGGHHSDRALGRPAEALQLVLANQAAKIAVEFDGPPDRSLNRREADRRKDSGSMPPGGPARFTNGLVAADAEACALAALQLVGGRLVIVQDMLPLEGAPGTAAAAAAA